MCNVYLQLTCFTPGIEAWAEAISKGGGHFGGHFEGGRHFEHGLEALHYAISKADAYNTVVGGWVALRVSIGMSGIVLRGSDVHAFAEHLWQHHRPDHLGALPLQFT